MSKHGMSLFALAVVAGVSASAAPAQTYPAKAVRLVVGYPPGGGTDATARIVGQKLAEALGQPVVIENRPGATGIIANEFVAKSAPDGYTLLMLTANDTALPALHASLPFDLVRDFSPVSLLTIGPMVIVSNPALPARNVQELIGLARSGKMTFGSSGIGGTPHLAGELLASMAKVKLLHVAYKGGAQLVIAVSSGEIDMCFTSITSALSLIGTNRLKAIAVSSAKRVSSLPAVPTIAESGLPGYDYSSWYGIAAPAGVPKNVVGHLNGQIAKVVNTPEMKESLGKQGFEPQTDTAENFAALIKREIEQNTRLAKLAGVKAQ